jgi:hypothetical protein
MVRELEPIQWISFGNNLRTKQGSTSSL